MPDPLLFHTADGGDIEYRNGRVVTADGLETAVYLSLFGGNARDGGGEAEAHLQWWGNLGEADPAKHYRSQTQHLLRSLPATPANLRRLEDAALADLQWLVDGKWATFVRVDVTMPAINRVAIEVSIEVDARVHEWTLTSDWPSS